MNIQTKKIPISQVQIDPKNPRSISKEKYKKLKASIEAFPQMLEVRPIVVADGIVLGGNMRLLVMKDLGYKEVPAIDVTEWTQGQRDEFMIKDNVTFGDWNYDSLANEWEGTDLDDWGLDLWQHLDDIETSDTFNLPEGDKAPFQQQTYTLADAQAWEVKNAVDKIKDTEEYKTVLTFGNENSNGNALYLIITQWGEQKK